LNLTFWTLVDLTKINEKILVTVKDQESQKKNKCKQIGYLVRPKKGKKQKNKQSEKVLIKSRL